VVGFQPPMSDQLSSPAPLGEMSLFHLYDLLVKRWKFVVGTSLMAGGLTLGITYLVPPTFTAVTTFIGPQQQQNGAAAVLSSLGALGGLTGLSSAVKSPIDQYVSLMQSATVTDKIIDRFKLIELYEVKLRADARRRLDANLRVNVGKKDNIISVEVDDHDPARAAEMANAFVEELRNFCKGLALTEAQQRRVFFEEQLQLTRDRLAAAQSKLQSTGVTASAIKAEPKSATEAYARLKAEADATEIRLATERQRLSESAPEIQALKASLSAYREQLRQVEASRDTGGGADYVGAYRLFKYQEAMFELFSKQFEAAKLDESKDFTVIQVVDKATPPERKSQPKRAMLALLATSVAALLLCAVVVVSEILRYERACRSA